MSEKAIRALEQDVKQAAEEAVDEVVDDHTMDPQITSLMETLDSEAERMKNLDENSLLLNDRVGCQSGMMVGQLTRILRWSVVCRQCANGKTSINLDLPGLDAVLQNFPASRSETIIYRSVQSHNGREESARLSSG